MRFRGDTSVITVISGDPGMLVSSGGQPPQRFDGTSINVPVDVQSIGAVPLRRIFDDHDRAPVVQLPVHVAFPDGAVVDGSIDMQATDVRTILAKRLEAVTRGPVPLVPEGTGTGVVAMYPHGVFYTVETVRDASTIGDIALVAMVEEHFVSTGSCGSYSNGRESVRVERGRHDAVVTFYDRRTGAQRSMATVRGPNITCPSTLSAATTIASEALSHESLRSWIASHVPE